MWLTYRGVSSEAAPALPVESDDSIVASYQLDVRPQDAREVVRAVGYYEFGMALLNLEKLIASATREELAAFDALVKDRDEFSVFVNLSRKVPHPPSSLDEEAERPGDNFERRGLAWVTALARIEVGAMLATFTEVREPFRSLAGTGFDHEAYAELIQDGMRSHYWALANDDNLPQVVRKRPGQDILNYVRRLVMAQAFWQATFQVAADNYSPVQLQELKAWEKYLDELQVGLLSHLSTYLESRSGSNDAFSQSCGAACDRLKSRSSP